MPDNIDYQGLAEQLGEISADPEKQQQLEAQMKLSENLRHLSSNAPKGVSIPSGTGKGDVYIAPNALQTAAGVGGNLVAQGQQQGAVNQMGSMANQEQRARQMMMQQILANQIRQGQQNPSQSQGQAPMDPSQMMGPP